MVPKKKKGRKILYPPASDILTDQDDEITRKMKNLVSSQFLDDTYSDLSIVCGDKVFPAHRNIICPQSKYFELACNGKFKEGTGEINLNGQDPNLVKLTLEFLYTGDYTCDFSPATDKDPNSPQESSSDYCSTAKPTGSTRQSCLHAQMYSLGDYFQIEALKAKAKKYFEHTFMKYPVRESFTSAVVEVYTSTGKHDRGLRDLVVQLTRDNLPQLRTEENPILDSTLLELAPDFLFDICLSVLDKCAQYQRNSRPYNY